MLHLLEMAHTATNGLGQMVVVAGEAGVGKSRLVAELKKVCSAGMARSGHYGGPLLRD